MTRGRILLTPAPLAALGMAFFLIEIGLATLALGTAPPGRETSLAAFFTSVAGLRIAADVAGVAAAGGFYVVTLFAAVQAEAPPERRARIIAAINILNSIFMVGGTLATALLQSGLIGLSESQLLIGLGLANLGAAAYVQRQIMPHSQVAAAGSSCLRRPNRFISGRLADEGAEGARPVGDGHFRDHFEGRGVDRPDIVREPVGDIELLPSGLNSMPSG